MVELQGSPASKSFLSGKGLGLEVRVLPRAPGVVEPKPHGHELLTLSDRKPQRRRGPVLRSLQFVEDP